MVKYQKPIIVLILCLIFTAVFLRNTRSDFPLIFKKDLLAHDESSNSVVAANITRKFFPPVVRVNSLDEQQGIWMEGPYWQHIPPLFAYVPYLFFELDGEVTIEVKRLAFAFVTWLTGILFIFGIYMFRRNIWSALAATVAVIAWVNTPFTHELITGYAFGVSDIVLAFTAVCSFLGILWYLKGEREERINYPYWKLILISILVAVPIMAKNLLGAIPPAIFFALLLRDQRRINSKTLTAAGSFLGILVAYYLPLYFASPETFKNEILVSFLHLDNLEGWGRPVHHYISNYLPQRYLFAWTWWYFAGLIFGIWYLVYGIKKQIINRYDKVLLSLSLAWFAWNILAVSLVESKIANFIYQSYLFSLFFVIYSLITAIPHLMRDLIEARSPLPRGWATGGLALALVLAILFTGREVVRFADQFKAYRTQAYDYQSEHEKFYEQGEKLRDFGLNTQDLVILNVPPNDCWFRYYILFLTGSEAKTLLEMRFSTATSANIRQKYKAVYFIDRDFSFKQIQPEELDAILAGNSLLLEQEILRIKKDKTSCQWLVPDSILNAP